MESSQLARFFLSKSSHAGARSNEAATLNSDLPFVIQHRSTYLSRQDKGMASAEGWGGGEGVGGGGCR